DMLAELRGEKIGFVFQSFHLMPSLTALENILAPMEIRGLRNARDRAQRLLEDVDLVARAHHYPSQLSGGEQQRVAIARAFANDPSIMLRSEEHTSELQSHSDLVCRLLLEKTETVCYSRDGGRSFRDTLRVCA